MFVILDTKSGVVLQTLQSCYKSDSLYGFASENKYKLTKNRQVFHSLHILILCEIVSVL